MILSPTNICTWGLHLFYSILPSKCMCVCLARYTVISLDPWHSIATFIIFAHSSTHHGTPGVFPGHCLSPGSRLSLGLAPNPSGILPATSAAGSQTSWTRPTERGLFPGAGWWYPNTAHSNSGYPVFKRQMGNGSTSGWGNEEMRNRFKWLVGITHPFLSLALSFHISGCL